MFDSIKSFSLRLRDGVNVFERKTKGDVTTYFQNGRDVDKKTFLMYEQQFLDIKNESN